MSPYLFAIAMEALSSLLLRARKGGFISRFKVKGRGGEGKEVSHLPFANDTIAFARLLRIKSIIDVGNSCSSRLFQG